MTRTIKRKGTGTGIRAAAAPAPASTLLCALCLLAAPMLLTGCSMLQSGRTAPAPNRDAAASAKPQPQPPQQQEQHSQAPPVDAAVLIPKCQTIVRDTYAGQPVTYGPPSAEVHGEAATVTVPFMLPRPGGSHGDSYAKYACRFTGTALTGSGLTP